MLELRLDEIKTRLRQVRHSRGISTAELATSVGKSTASIRRLENPASDSLCDFMVFAGLCQCLDVNVEYILFGERRESSLVSDAEFELRNREANKRLSKRQRVAVMNMLLALTEQE